MADKAYRVAPGSKASALYDLAFDTARELASFGGAEAASCLRHLILQPGCFRPALAGDALLALTAAAPGEFKDHLDLLRRSLKMVFGIQERSTDDDERRVGDRRRLIDALLSRIRPRHQLLYAMRPDAGLHRPEDRNWWFNTIRSEFPELYGELERYLASGVPLPGVGSGFVDSGIIVDVGTVVLKMDTIPNVDEEEMARETGELGIACLGSMGAGSS
jgi:hypothetical protein